MKTLLTITILLLAAFAHAQQPKPDVKPVTPNAEATDYKLKPEAAKAMTSLFQEMQTETDRHNAEVKRISDLETAIMKGADIPAAEWPKRMFAKPDPDGSLPFVLKPKVEAAKVQP